ncbi:MAG TPA: PAS domain-containing protein [Alphaproteobacteria bacterium]
MHPVIADDPILSSLWRYWDAKRGRRRMPLRRDIEPAEIPRLLPHLQLVERVEGKGFRYRLTGTAIVQGYGFDGTGKFTHEILTPARHKVASGHYSMVFESGRPIFARNHYVKDGFLLAKISRIILPLSVDGESVGMLLLGHSFAAPTPEEQNTADLRVEIQGDEIEYLDGAPTLSLVKPLRVAAAR